MNLYKIYTIIPKRRMKQIPLITFALILGAVFEVLGISLIIPMMNVFSGSNKQSIDFFMNYFPIVDEQNFVIFMVIFFALIYLLKGLYLSGLAWLTSRFTYVVKAEVSNSLMKKYLSAPYEFHLLRNSAELIRNLTTEANQFVSFALNPILLIISESLVIFAIGIYLLVIEPQVTIIVILLLFVLSYAFQQFLSGYSRRIGEIRQHADGIVIKRSQETLGGIKDVIFLGKEVQFYNQFVKNNLISSYSSAKQNAIGQLPRMYLETIGIISFAILILLMLNQGADFREVIPILGAFSLAAFRLLPSANRILSSINSLRYVESVVNNLNNELTMTASKDLQEESPKIQSACITFSQKIELKNISYRYPQSQGLALSCINLTVRKGDSVGVVGKSGSGKSTLSDLILGLLKPTTGVISVDGANIEQSMKRWQNIIGYVQQDIFLLDDSIKRNIAFGEVDNEIDHNKIIDAVNEAQLTELITSLPDGLNTQLGERGVRLSGGQKQRIGIARALYRNAPIIIFDEATSALDIETEAEIVSSIRSLKGKRTIIVIAHRLSTIKYCNRIIELKNGQIHKIKEQI